MAVLWWCGSGLATSVMVMLVVWRGVDSSSSGDGSGGELVVRWCWCGAGSVVEC